MSVLGAFLAAVALLAGGPPSATIGRDHVRVDADGARLAVGFDGGVRVLRRPAPPQVEPGGGPVPSPDGRYRAWFRFLPGSLELVAGPPTGPGRVLVHRICEGPFSWSPDSTRIAVIVPEPGTGCGAGRQVDLAVVGLDGRFQRVMRGVSGSPLWSPAGRTILLQGGGAAVLVRADGSGARSLPVEGFAWWSPDGHWVAAVGGDHTTVQLVRADGSGLRRLATGFDTDVMVVFSPDSRELAASYDGGLLLADVTGRRRITIGVDGFVNFASLAWSGRHVTVDARAYTPGD